MTLPLFVVFNSYILSLTSVVLSSFWFHSKTMVSLCTGLKAFFSINSNPHLWDLQQLILTLLRKNLSACCSKISNAKSEHWNAAVLMFGVKYLHSGSQTRHRMRHTNPKPVYGAVEAAVVATLVKIRTQVLVVRLSLDNMSTCEAAWTIKFLPMPWPCIMNKCT